MVFWTAWLDAIRGLLHMLSSDVGLGAGLGIVALTLLLRSAALPISWPSAYRGSLRQKKLKKLQPELQRIKDQFGKDPRLLAERTIALYRENDLSPFDGRSLLGALAQMPVFLGMFQVLRDGAETARFLWVSSLSRPDVWLSLVAGLTTALVMAANPDLPEQTRLLMIVIPSVVVAIMALKFCSALAVYWAASNCFSAVQTIVLHIVVNRQIRSGTVRI
jgi:YidC/Oxa1 family membrane protein insertase